MDGHAEKKDLKFKNGRSSIKMDAQAEKNGRSNWKMDAQSGK